MKKITVRIEDSTYDLMKNYIYRYGWKSISFQDLINEAVKLYIKNETFIFSNYTTHKTFFKKILK